MHKQANEYSTTFSPKNSPKIILSADSTCDIGDELKNRYQVHYVPLHIILNERDYKDGIDISPEQVYQEYYDQKTLPKTAAVNVAEYLAFFRPWVDEGYDVIHINIGGALSSSHQNCLLAAEELGHVYAIDSCSLSSGTGLLVADAGDMIASGMNAPSIAKALKERIPKCHASFVLDTLTFLHAGGRCSAVAALGANLLKLKPCIEVDNRDGSMNVGKKYRGTLDKVLTKYVQDELSKYPDLIPDRLFITHSGISQEYIDLVKKAVVETTSFKEIQVTKACCTISSHCGPNTLGILFETL